VCSAILTIKEKFHDKKALYDCLAVFMKNAKSFSPNKVSGGSTSNLPKDNYRENGSTVAVGWDPSKTGGGINITENNTQCFLKEQSYLFRTTLATQGFTSGIHYWEILADSRTENELKIGVTTNKDFDYNSAFCDHPFGFAYYGIL